MALANSPRNSGFHPHGQHEVLHIDQNSDESPQKLVDFPSTLTPPPAPKTKTSKAKMLLMVQIKKKTKMIRQFLFLAVFFGVMSILVGPTSSAPSREVSLDPHSMCCILEANTGIVLQHSAHSSNIQQQYGAINPEKNMFPLPNNGPKRILQTATARCQVWNLAFVLIGR